MNDLGADGKPSSITYINYKGKNIKVEIHWYEANGNRFEIRMKRVFDDES